MVARKAELMSKTIHIALDETEFLTLVSGGTFVTVHGGQEVRIILSDIGFDRMLAPIFSVIRNQQGESRADPR